MINKDKIKEILSDFRERNFDEIKPREISIPVNSGKIITLTGVRRSGKTYLLLDLIKELLKKGINKKNIIYLNFEDERLNFETYELDLVLQAQRELYPGIKLSNCYFFFDEIQNITDWEKFIRRLYDSVSKKIILTGSNSKLLSSEIATSLRGRTVTYEVFPLSFSEYLDFKKINYKLFSSANKGLVNNAFDDYLKNGGYPEAVFLDKTLRDKTLQSYYQVMIYKDITERYNVTNVNLLNYFLTRIISNLSKPTSVNKIYNELKSNGYKTTKNFLYDILDWAENIYFIFKIQRFDYSVVNRERTEKKYYVIDNGIVNAMTFNFSDDNGKLLENAVAIHLRKHFGNNLFYYKEKFECDFVAFIKDRPSLILQVCWDVSDNDTKQREIRGLIAACNYFKQNSGLIITHDYSETVKVEGINIEFISASKFLLNTFPE